MTHAAIHDALNAIDRRYYPYNLIKRAEPDASPQAAVATAAHAVLVDQFNRLIAFGFRSQQEALDAAYAESLASIPDGPAKTKGVAVGRTAAEAILALRVADGWDTQPDGGSQTSAIEFVVLSVYHQAVVAIIFLSDGKLAALTVAHNYRVTRSDGTTAAERFFGAKPANLFAWLVDHLDVPARPAAKRSKNSRKAA